MAWSVQLHLYVPDAATKPHLGLEPMLHRMEGGYLRRSAEENPDLWERKCGPEIEDGKMSALKAGQTYRQFYERIDAAAEELGFRSRLKGLRERLDDNIGKRSPLVNQGATESTEWRVLWAEAEAMYREFDFLCAVLYVWLRQIGYSHDDLE